MRKKSGKRQKMWSGGGGRETCSVPVLSSLKSNIAICSCTGQDIQLKMLKSRPNEGGTGMCLR